MDYAKHVGSNTIYPAQAFADLLNANPAEFDRLNDDLVCPECYGPAFFRRAARNGQAACFAARPHAQGCGMAAGDQQRLIEAPGEDVNALWNPGNRIRLDFNFGAVEQVNAVPEADDFQGQGNRARRFQGDQPRPKAVANRRLRPLLRRLVTDPTFATSDVLIELPDGTAMPANQFFVPFSDVSRYKTNPNHLRGYWGMISSAKSNDSDVWLNSGGNASVSIPLSKTIQQNGQSTAQAILHRANITNLNELEGAYILAIGRTYKSQNYKPYCTIESPDHIAIYLTN